MHTIAKVLWEVRKQNKKNLNFCIVKSHKENEFALIEFSDKNDSFGMFFHQEHDIEMQT